MLPPEGPAAINDNIITVTLASGLVVNGSLDHSSLSQSETNTTRVAPRRLSQRPITDGGMIEKLECCVCASDPLSGGSVSHL
eukprot:622770-Hanusia_phi.AAC.1